MIARIIRRIIGSCSPSLEPEPFYMAKNPKYASFDIGDWSYGHPTVCSWNQGTTLKIGRFCSIASGVTILLGGEHKTSWITTYPFAELFPGADSHPLVGCSKGNVTIGNDVWVGQDALILSGVKIGDGAVVAAGSIVTRDVAPYSIVGGNPARCIRFRFSEDVIKSLIEIAWWNWSLEEIQKSLPMLLSAETDAFVTNNS